MKNRFTRLRWTAIALLLIGLIAGIVMHNVLGDLIRVVAFAVAVVLLFIDYRQGRSQPR
ncbi:MAG: hypothetical protein QOJ33_132 [Chloroflexota bacterium]|jgi:hypothetical protein|nr:hypothetical protein [Chloroflexota bacterium]MEA2667198.1 hypothetical protein [Chloroflexota bacterium]